MAKSWEEKRVAALAKVREQQEKEAARRAKDIRKAEQRQRQSAANASKNQRAAEKANIARLSKINQTHQKRTDPKKQSGTQFKVDNIGKKRGKDKIFRWW
jgi:protein subunit release factor B